MSGADLTRPRLVLVDGGAELLEDFAVEANGIATTVPKGAWTDGASIPRWLWRVCGHPLEAPRVYAAVVHDWLYSGCGPKGMTRGAADGVYRELCVRFGVPGWRANVEYWALRAFGGSHWTERT